MPEHQDRGVVADRDLDLRHAVADRKAGPTSFRRGGIRREIVRRQDVAFAHVGDVGRAPLAEADHARRPCSARGAPRAARGGDSPTPRRRRSAACVSGCTLPMRARLSSSARCLAAICVRASACCVAQPPQTPKCGQRGARRPGLLRTASLTLENSYFDFFWKISTATRSPRQRALDEHHLALGVARDAAPLGVERLDVEDQVFQSERNSRQCGSARLSRTPRSRAHSLAYCSALKAPRSSWKRR